MNIKQLLTETFVRKCLVDSNIGFVSEHIFFLENFSEFCQEQLGLPQLPKIRICGTREGGMTTGAFIPSKDEILVYGKDRALVDILRTLGHELTHYRQRLNGQIKSTERDWDLESEADTEAGKLVYNFAHSSDENMKIYDF